MIALAFVLIYTAWGTTFLAIQEGVRTLPAGLFSGARVALAGSSKATARWHAVA